MTLAFLNPSRSFDETRNAVLFFGHDGMQEIRFFVEATALVKPAEPDRPLSEALCLSAFDAMRSTVQLVADKVYSRHRRNLNILTAVDFR
jgi:hypothetical protein